MIQGRTIGVGLAAVAACGLAIGAGTPARAQAPPPPTASDIRASGTAASARPVTEVLAKIGESAGITILADATVRGQHVPMPAVPATPETAEQQIAAVVKALPAGALWARLYVPAPANGRWNADIVSEYAHAQAQLVGTVGAAAPPGTVEILGRHIPESQAAAYISGLGLKLVYLVTNPRPVSAASAGNSSWLQMNADQRQQYAHDQAQQLLTLDPNAMAQSLQSLMDQGAMVMKQVMLQLTPEQRQSVMNAMGASGDGIHHVVIMKRDERPD